MQAVDTVAGCHLFAHTIAQPHRQLRIEGLSQFHFSSFRSLFLQVGMIS